ncbi:hypothetical protein [Micromonospora sp. LOL_023]
MNDRTELITIGQLARRSGSIPADAATVRTIGSTTAQVKALARDG